MLPPEKSATAVDATGNATLPACSVSVTTLCISTYNIAANAAGITTDPTLMAAINAQPLPNDFTLGDGLNTAAYNFASPQHEQQYDFSTKIDYKFSDNSAMYVQIPLYQNSFGDSETADVRSFRILRIS